MNEKKVFIVPIDGVENVTDAYDRLEDVLSAPDFMIDYVSHVKFNDAFHLENAKILLCKIHENYPELNVFFDFKLADTNGTNVNVLKHYLPFMKVGDIV